MDNCDGEHGGSSDGGGFVLFNKVISIDLPKWLKMIQVLMEVREQVSGEEHFRQRCLLLSLLLAKKPPNYSLVPGLKGNKTMTIKMMP